MDFLVISFFTSASVAVSVLMNNAPPFAELPVIATEKRLFGVMAGAAPGVLGALPPYILLRVFSKSGLVCVKMLRFLEGFGVSKDFSVLPLSKSELR